MSFAETFPHQVIVGDGKPALYADISDAEFYAIGKMTTSWAILEHAMMATALRLGKKAGVFVRASGSEANCRRHWVGVFPTSRRNARHRCDWSHIPHSRATRDSG